MERDLTSVEVANGNGKLTGGHFSTYSENSEFFKSINLCLDHRSNSSNFVKMIKGAGCCFVAQGENIL